MFGQIVMYWFGMIWMNQHALTITKVPCRKIIYIFYRVGNMLSIDWYTASMVSRIPMQRVKACLLGLTVRKECFYFPDLILRDHSSILLQCGLLIADVIGIILTLQLSNFYKHQFVAYPLWEAIFQVSMGILRMRR